jgi:protease-4
MTATGSSTVAPPGLALRRLLRNVGGLLREAALLPVERLAPRRWLVVRLDRGLTEVPGPFLWLGERLQAPRPLPAVLAALRRAAEDPGLRGVLLRVGGRSLGWSKAVVLARAVRRLREAGKLAVVYAERTGNAGAWLGALADRFWIAPEGRVDLLGIRTESPFLRRALERLRIRPEVLQVGRYKSIAEILTRDSMSRESREALEGVVEELYGALVGGLASGRAGSPEKAREWIDGGPYVASEAREIGLVDDLLYPDEIPARLEALHEGREAPEGVLDARLVGEGAYLRLRPGGFRWRPLWARPDRIVVLPIVGLLGPGAASPRGVVGALRALAKDRSVAAVVLRIDSPGGDPLAADLLWRAVRQLASRKPVVASLGDTAASGGYYVAMAASAVVAESTTLTGSIGVVWAMVDLGAALEELGVRFESVERGAHAGIYDMTRSRTEEERTRLRKQVERIYQDFVDKVAQSRGLPLEQVRAAAEGRIWSGAAALEQGLVDEIGGLDLAVLRARERAGLPADGPEPEYLRGHAPALRRLLSPEPVGLGEVGLTGPALLCPLRIPLR